MKQIVHCLLVSTQVGSAPSLGDELELRALRAETALSGNDRQVLSFLTAHADEIGIHTAESISQGAGVSTAAVVRLARRLGYSGFRELRDRARAELREAPPRAEQPKTEGMFARKLADDARALELLASLIADGSITRAAEILARARSVWVLANHESHGLAVYFQRLLHNVRPAAFVIDAGHAHVVRDISSDDAVVVLTFRPYARRTIEILPVLRARGARLIVVADSAAAPFFDRNDLSFVVPVTSPTIFLSLVPAMALVEAIAAGVSRVEPDSAHAALEGVGDVARELNLALEPPNTQRAQ